MISEENFLGNEKITRYLNKTLDKGCVSHAYLFEGPEHIGKSTLALRFAADLLEDDFEKIVKNPDLISIAPNEDSKRQISVEQIRELQKDLSLFPFRAKYKIAIIEKAELMNRTAANSLLKTLEEPGKTSILILTTSNSENILDTIKSRCQIFNFSSASADKLGEFLKNQAQSDLLPKVLEFAQGKPGLAINLLNDPELLKTMEERKSRILSLFDSNNAEKLEKAAPIFALEKEEVLETLDVWISALRLELLKDLNEDKNNEKMISIKKIKNALDQTISTREDISSKNINVRLSIENLCLSF
ncbi:MAG: hypothetical protein WC178_03745 [Candidatus Paceibacterota bacterium]